MSDDPALTVSSPQYSRVSPEKAALILQLKQERPNITQQQIADIVGVHQTTVGDWLRALTDTVPAARQLAKSQALHATKTLSDHIDNPDPRVSLGAAKAITALAGVQEGSQTSVSVGVQVVVGSPTQPAGPDPFIEASVVESKS